MLDSDLAEIYGYRTKKFNEQVKNNIEKFDEDFRFRLTSEEFEILKSKIWTSNCENSTNFDNFYKKGNLRSKIWTSSDESKVEPQGILRCKNFTSSESNKLESQKILRSKKSASSWGGARYAPYAFTEQGIYMLMTVLKGEQATAQSKALIRLFKQMKDYIAEQGPHPPFQANEGLHCGGECTKYFCWNGCIGDADKSKHAGYRQNCYRCSHAF